MSILWWEIILGDLRNVFWYLDGSFLTYATQFDGSRSEVLLEMHYSKIMRQPKRLSSLFFCSMATFLHFFVLCALQIWLTEQFSHNFLGGFFHEIFFWKVATNGKKHYDTIFYTMSSVLWQSHRSWHDQTSWNFCYSHSFAMVQYNQWYYKQHLLLNQSISVTQE